MESGSESGGGGGEVGLAAEWPLSSGSSSMMGSSVTEAAEARERSEKRSRREASVNLIFINVLCEKGSACV